MTIMKCRYCFADIHNSCSRCSHCGSWLKTGPFFKNAETNYKTAALILAFVAAGLTWYQASEALKERRVTEELKRDVMVIAENMTKMTYVLADGSIYFDGIPKQHMQQINEYKNALQKYLSPAIDKEIRDTIEKLDKEVGQKR